MVTSTNKEVVSFLMKGNLPADGNQNNVRQVATPQKQNNSQLKTQRNDVGANPQNTDTREQVKQQPVKVEKTVGRNDPCPCGSGKKFKSCHGA